MEEEGLYALERELPHGRTDAICGPPDRWRSDERTLPRIRDLPEDRLQDLGPLPGDRDPGSHRQESPALPDGQPASASTREHHRPPPPGETYLGSPEDPRAAGPPIPGRPVPCHQHHPCRPGSSWTGQAPPKSPPLQARRDSSHSGQAPE